MARSVSNDRVVGHRARDSVHLSRLSHSPVGSSQQAETELQTIIRAELPNFKDQTADDQNTDDSQPQASQFGGGSQ